MGAMKAMKAMTAMKAMKATKAVKAMKTTLKGKWCANPKALVGPMGGQIRAIDGSRYYRHVSMLMQLGPPFAGGPTHRSMPGAPPSPKGGMRPATIPTQCPRDGPVLPV